MSSDHLVNPGAFSEPGRPSPAGPFPPLGASANPTAADGPRGVSGEALDPPEREGENDLRPRRLADFVGQERVVSNLSIALQAARERGEALDHVLLAGGPGLGKTSLARILSAELETELHATSGPALERPKDLVGILTQLKHGDVFFIDEIHRVPAAVEEYLYTAMEDFSVDFTLDQGPHARILPLRLAPFTLVGATTREGLLSSPFRGRFGMVERLVPYPDEDLVRIVLRSAGLLSLEVARGAAGSIARRSRGTPRIANRFLRRVRDLAQVSQRTSIEDDLVHDAMERLGVDERGLDEMDRSVLRCLVGAAGSPVGLKTIAAAIGESEDTVEEVYEPHLLRCGFLQKTSRGRVITAAGARVIGAVPPTDADGRAALPFDDA